MACSNPFYRYSKYTNSYSRIPCGWCLSCRIDKRNYYTDKLEYCLHKEFNSVGTFLCITYDDNHIPMNSDCSDYTLRMSDSVNFIKRLRSYINYHKKEFNPLLVSSKFKFFGAGEYGGKTSRPHMHYIVCGLDWQYASDVFRKCWKNGVIIDSKPILRGGIRYVCKYLDKQQFGDKLIDLYDRKGIERPFMHCSHSFSRGLYATSDHFYVWHNKKRPLPIWIKNQRCIKTDSVISDKVLEFSKKIGKPYDFADSYLRQSTLNYEQNLAHFNNEPVDDLLNGVSASNINLQFRHY